jgi:Flp pilus assembly protein TadG
MKQVKKEFLDNDSGAVAVFVAIGLVVFLGCAALALDIAHMVSVRRELVKAAEAGALSGARGLWPVVLVNGTSRDPDCTAGAAKALATATDNVVNGSNLAAAEVTAEPGQWNYAAKTFTPGSNSSANGVRVTTHRNNVPMILAQFLGQDPKNMSASAVAVMDFVGTVGKGCLPIAINSGYVNPPFPNITSLFINFTPDPSDNAGWFTDPPDPASAKTIKDYIDGNCPPLYQFQQINLQNGNDATCLQDLQTQLQAVNAAGGDWIVCLPVVNTDKFNQQSPIESFCSFKITAVNDSGNPKGVTGYVQDLSCFETGLPGGAKSGALAPPKLVQ